MSSPVSERKVKSGAGAPSRTTSASSVRRALGIVRVSRVGDREGESFGSPSEQTKRIEDACERENLQLIDVIREMDVSGGTPLEKRKGLREAVERVEAGEADVIVVAYLDRLVRSYRVQAEVVERIKAAGGAVLAVDVGQLTNGSAGRWLSAGMLDLALSTTAARRQSAPPNQSAARSPGCPDLQQAFRPDTDSARTGLSARPGHGFHRPRGIELRADVPPSSKSGSTSAAGSSAASTVSSPTGLAHRARGTAFRPARQ